VRFMSSNEQEENNMIDITTTRAYFSS